MKGAFSAHASTLGYLYQLKYAFLLLIKSDADAQLVLEGLDDIEISQQDSTDLHQIKHHVKPASLSDLSKDLWSTLRVWSDQYSKLFGSESKSGLLLITTAVAPADSAASYLLPGDVGNRDPKLALQKLLEARRASKSTDSKIQNCFKAFDRLSAEQQLHLMGQAVILDGTVQISEINECLENELELAVRPEFLTDLRTRLEGWWLDRSIRHLCANQSDIIRRVELMQKVHELQEEYYADSLPIHFSDLVVPREEELPEDKRIFIDQLRVVLAQEPRIQLAIADYYRAYRQRSKWLRIGSIDHEELRRYENKLVDEWKRLFLDLKEQLGDNPSDDAKEKGGRSLFSTVDGQSHLHIRPRCIEPYVMRGTYHMLSNNLEVGWHPEFLDLLQASYEQAQGEV